MPTVVMVEYEQASPEVRAVYDEIMAVKGINFVPNFWKTLASHPPLLEEVWRGLNRAMAPGRLDALTKEMVALAVSATNGCTYCIRSHTAAARKLGMDDAMLGACGCTHNDTEGLINLPLTAREIQAVVFFKVGSDGAVRVSMRSKYDVDVRVVANVYGGGGHKNAAGFTVAGPLEQARPAILERVVTAIARGLETRRYA